MLHCNGAGSQNESNVSCIKVKGDSSNDGVRDVKELESAFIVWGESTGRGYCLIT